MITAAHKIYGKPLLFDSRVYVNKSKSLHHCPQVTRLKQEYALLSSSNVSEINYIPLPLYFYLC